MSRALRFEVFDARWEMVRAIDGLTRQLLTTSARVDGQPWLDRLPPGGSWTRELNLSEWHYPLPEGEYQFVARLTYPPSEIDAECPPLPLRVTPGRLQTVTAAKDNPGLERVLLLLTEQSPEGRFYRTRFYASTRPLVVRAEAAFLLTRPPGSRSRHRPSLPGGRPSNLSIKVDRPVYRRRIARRLFGARAS